MKLWKILAELLLLAIASIVFVYFYTQPVAPEDATESAARLEPGPYPVSELDYTFVDESRPTMKNGDQAAKESRTFVSRIWWSDAAPSSRPLVVYSHGFMSERGGGAYMASHLASHGYVVVSTDYPLTNLQTPGGPNVADAVTQPGDVSFLIDQMLSGAGGDATFFGEIDGQRIGVFGISLGGLTSTLVSFHPRMRDPRIKASISIAGPAVMFTPRFFAVTDVPFLMIAGTSDAMVDYDSNAKDVPAKIGRGGLLTIATGSHTGFTNLAEPAMRLFDNPDSLGCGALMQNLDISPDVNPFGSLTSESDGIVDPETGQMAMPCELDPLPSAIHPGRQHMITLLAVTSFFESQFAASDLERAKHHRFLAELLPADFEEVTFEGATGGDRAMGEVGG